MWQIWGTGYYIKVLPEYGLSYLIYLTVQGPLKKYFCKPAPEIVFHSYRLIIT